MVSASPTKLTNRIESRQSKVRWKLDSRVGPRLLSPISNTHSRLHTEGRDSSYKTYDKP